MGWSWWSFLSKHRSCDAFVICARWSQRLFFQTLQKHSKTWEKEETLDEAHFFPRRLNHPLSPHLNEVWSGFFDWAALLQKTTKALQNYDPWGLVVYGFTNMLHSPSQHTDFNGFQLPECMVPAWGVCCRVFPEYSNNWGIDESWDIPMHVVINVVGHQYGVKVWFQLFLAYYMLVLWDYGLCYECQRLCAVVCLYLLQSPPMQTCVKSSSFSVFIYVDVRLYSFLLMYWCIMVDTSCIYI